MDKINHEIITTIINKNIDLFNIHKYLSNYSSWKFSYFPVISFYNFRKLNLCSKYKKMNESQKLDILNFDYKEKSNTISWLM